LSKPILNYICSKVSKKFKFGTYIKTGKNFSGKICVFHRGGGNKKIYRCIDFYRRLNFFGVVYSIQYDPYRSAYIGLVLYDNGLFSSIVLSDGLAVGNKIFSGKEIIAENCLSKGSSLALSNLGLFTIVSNVESRPLFGAALARAAGSGAITLSFVDKFVNIKLKSGWIVKVSSNVVASLGYVSNMLHNMTVIGKAGKNRGLGKRPIVRGVAMNPCDHPHGGGNGKTSPPVMPVTP